MKDNDCEIMKGHCKHILDKLVINKFIFDRSSVVMHVNTHTQWLDQHDLLSYQNPVCEIQ